MKKCLVMVATYNGEKYLREQLDSILSQQGVEVYVKVADDCSTDNTCEILSEYKQAHTNFDY
ncbi:MAG: glycosyltransferase, partial [Clostridia bacterium]|nr:glycosyltransferase [Clostridia bacterium]